MTFERKKIENRRNNVRIVARTQTDSDCQTVMPDWICQGQNGHIRRREVTEIMDYWEIGREIEENDKKICLERKRYILYFYYILQGFDGIPGKMAFSLGMKDFRRENGGKIAWGKTIWWNDGRIKIRAFIWVTQAEAFKNSLKAWRVWEMPGRNRNTLWKIQSDANLLKISGNRKRLRDFGTNWSISMFQRRCFVWDLFYSEERP